jgi:hypothetical protein
MPVTDRSKRLILYRTQQCHISRTLEMRPHLSREMRISKGDETSSVGNDRISYGRFPRISKFRDM